MSGSGIGSYGSASGDSGSSSSGSENGSLSGSGGSCPDYPWEKVGFNGASWTGDGWSLRISFEDSENCGGPNALGQSGTASRRVCLDRPTRLAVQMTGLVETQNAGFEVAEARVDGQLVCSGGSFEEGGGCTMKEASATGSFDLAAGEHLIELSAGTNDGLYHVGAFWEFSLTWEPLP